MAIRLDKYCAPLCLRLAEEEKRMTPESSATILMYDISRHWRTLLDSTSFRSDEHEGWSEKEVAAGGVILSSVAYLRKIGCDNIEDLLEDIIRRRAGTDV